jgi:hypothetical protein
MSGVYIYNTGMSSCSKQTEILVVIESADKYCITSTCFNRSDVDVILRDYLSDCTNISSLFGGALTVDFCFNEYDVLSLSPTSTENSTKLKKYLNMFCKDGQYSISWINDTKNSQMA